MTFPELVEYWTAHYVPMQHNPTAGNKRFYFTDSFMGLVDFSSQITASLSPCLVMESGREGVLLPSKAIYNYALYFMVRADDMASGDSAAEAKMEAEVHMRAFYTWLLNRQQREEEADVRGIQLSEWVDFKSIGPLQDGWYAILLQLKDVQLVNTCINSANYI